MGSFKARLFRNEKGVSAVEYALIAALIILAMLAELSHVAPATNKMWNNVSETVQNA